MNAVAKYPTNLYKKIRKFLTGKKEEEGASLVEYALLVSLIAVACIVAIGLLGDQINAVFTAITTAITPK